MTSNFRKTIFLFFILFALFLWGKPQESVLAFFEDQEATQAPNLFQAGPLDFSLSSDSDFAPEITPTQNSERIIYLHNWGNPFNYYFRTTDISGNLCNFIVLTAYLNGQQICTGSLATFQCTDLEFNEGDLNPQEWKFVATLTDGASQNEECSFKFEYFGRQKDLSSGGFYDEEEILNTITSGQWLPESPKILINKIYYDVDSDHGQEKTNEWIELYNPNNDPVDLSGWVIEDNSSQDTLPSVLIPANGFLLISGSSDTWQYWPAIPDTTPKIALSDGKIGNGLANSGDKLLLKDPYGRVIDAMSYENNTDIFNPAPPLDGSGNTYDLPEGHILGRISTGFDTDSASDWKDYGIPSVQVTYPTGGIWGCGQNVTLRWQATNPNGPDSELLIDLYYIRDLDDNGTVSSGDAIDLIAKDIANTGSYNWTVSPCYYGYVWIKVVAHDSSNFMISNSALSGRVFEPPEGQNNNQQQNPSSQNQPGAFTQGQPQLTQSTDQETPDETSNQELTQASDQASEQASEQISEQAPDQTSDQASNQAEDQALQQTSDQTPDQTSDQPGDQASGQTSDQTSDQTTDQLSEQAPNSAPNSTPNQTPDQITDQTPDQINE